MNDYPTADGRPGVDTRRLYQSGTSSSIELNGGYIKTREGLRGEPDRLVHGHGSIEIGGDELARLWHQGSIRVAPFTPGQRTLTIKAAEKQTLLMADESDSEGEVLRTNFEVDGAFPGEVNQLRLVIEGKTNGQFGGNLKIGAADTAEFTHPWKSFEQVISMNGKGAPSTLTGGRAELKNSEIISRPNTTNVIENELQFSNSKIKLQSESTLELRGPTSIDAATAFQTDGIPSEMVFTDSATIKQRRNQRVFEWSSFNTTVRGGNLTLDVDEINDGNNSFWSAYLDLIDGRAEVNVNPDLHDGTWDNVGYIYFENGLLAGSHLINKSHMAGAGTIATDGFVNHRLITAYQGALEISATNETLPTSLAALAEARIEAEKGDISVTSANVVPDFHGKLFVKNGHTFSTTQPVMTIVEGTGKVDVFGGRVDVGGSLFQSGRLRVRDAPATISAQFIGFEETGTNEINHDLQLEGNSRVHFQAEFTGSGRIINKKGSAMHVPEGADIPLVLRNEGELKLGDDFSSSRPDVADYEQSTTGALQMRLRGDELGQSDRIIVTGMAELAGSLEILVGEEYEIVPYVEHSLMQTAAGVAGTFTKVASTSPAESYGFATTYDPTTVNVTLALLGDTNLDGSVEFADFLRLSSAFGTQGTWVDGDFDGDGEVAFPDFLALSGNFGESASVAVASVPEPHGCICMLLGIMGLFSSSRRIRSLARHRNEIISGRNTRDSFVFTSPKLQALAPRCAKAAGQ